MEYNHDRCTNDAPQGTTYGFITMTVLGACRYLNPVWVKAIALVDGQLSLQLSCFTAAEETEFAKGIQNANQIWSPQLGHTTVFDTNLIDRILRLLENRNCYEHGEN